MVWVSGAPRLERRMPKDTERWFFDNGAFAHGFDEDRFNRDMDRLPETADFGVLPDIVAAGLQSLDMSERYIDKVRKDWPWYLAVQDGMCVADVAPLMSRIDGLFLGGSAEFKQTAMAWAALAHGSDKKFHFARCGTLPRVRAARFAKADSIDSAAPLYQRDRMEAFVSWMTEQDIQRDWIAQSAKD